LVRVWSLATKSTEYSGENQCLTPKAVEIAASAKQ